jgi:hypothetical protein
LWDNVFRKTRKGFRFRDKVIDHVLDMFMSSF